MTNKNFASRDAELSKSRGRPKRNPVEIIWTLVLMREACFAAKIEFKGCQLEKHFEPETIKLHRSGTLQRSGKWDRYVRGKSTPGQETIDKIKKRYPELHHYYFSDSPLWAAMRAGEQTDEYWITFYQSLRPSLQKHIFVSDTGQSTRLKRRKLRSSSIDAILREGDLDALACLVALMRDGQNPPPSFKYQNLELAVYNLLFWTLTASVPGSFSHLIWAYFVTFIIEKDRTYFHHENLWQLSREEITDVVSFHHASMLKAEDLGLILQGKQTREFLYWKYKGNSQLIFKEIVEAQKVEKYELKEAPRGLKWLVKQLNKTRPKSEHIGNII